ncbi:Predicted membrane protein [Methanolobus vulcani]|jgi:Predicted membrane protein (DUF2178).|uniref:Predicted membrane protein n=2 Tax=Methanolobus vulcani TaxID=38026 RepID=A0A7Z7AXT6_9EURY|nr:hypothetical protein [Methanolobus sp.]MDK2948271.1 hypothetical protein [Methanolobus sp.]SDG09452.1 Predicted membrane protein [Methanolobus vulcani]
MFYIAINMKNQEIILLIAGLVLSGFGIYIKIYEPAWVSNTEDPGGGLIGAGVVLILTSLRNRHYKKKGIITEDERDYRIAEKASYRSFQIIFILQGFLFFILGISDIQLTAQSVIGVLFAASGIAYIGSFYWYRNKM